MKKGKILNNKRINHLVLGVMTIEQDNTDEKINNLEFNCPKCNKRIGVELEGDESSQYLSGVALSTSCPFCHNGIELPKRIFPTESEWEETKRSSFDGSLGEGTIKETKFSNGKVMVVKKYKNKPWKKTLVFEHGKTVGKITYERKINGQWKVMSTAEIDRLTGMTREEKWNRLVYMIVIAIIIILFLIIKIKGII